MATRKIIVTYPDTHPEHRIPVQMVQTDKLVVEIHAPGKNVVPEWNVGVVHQTGSPERQLKVVVSTREEDFTGEFALSGGILPPEAPVNHRFQVGKAYPPGSAGKWELKPAQVVYFNIVCEHTDDPVEDASCFVSTGNPK